MKEEIYSGIRNAMQRGSSLEESMQSFINAGYSETDVKEAGKMLAGGATEILQGDIPQNFENESLPQLPKKKSRKWLVLGVIIVAVVILGLGGFLAYYLMTP